MLLIYAPENGDRQEFRFQPGKLLSVEAELIEEAGGASWETYEEFGRKFMAGSIKARRAALWVMLKRTNPKLRFAELVIAAEEIDVDLEPEERARFRAAIELEADLSDEEREQLLASFPVDAESVEEEPGKDETGADSTDST